MRIGFVLLGLMGTLMARKLVTADFDVAGFDCNPKALAALE